MEKTTLKNIAIIGAGPTTLFLLQHILENANKLLPIFKEITVFEKSKNLGSGMPYNSETTDIYNIANICCEEIPKLPQSLNNWILSQSDTFLKKWKIDRDSFKEHELYSRIILGMYFKKQFDILIQELKSKGFKVIKHPKSEIKDIKIDNNIFSVIEKSGASKNFKKVVIATGHDFKSNDTNEKNYFKTPWPIQKLLPKKSQYYNYPIGILGASLSAFDVVTSLAHRHGKFFEKDGILKFKLNKEALEFKIILHSLNGWLPHLQYEQLEPMREVYRHATREQVLDLVSRNGFISLKDFFDKIARKALIIALKKDKKTQLARQLSLKNFDWIDLINILSEEHEYVNSFNGMEKELQDAESNLRNNQPTYWMETLDDLMYCLNFHSELISAEDHIFLRKEIMPFLMNVIAALPLKSAKILIALKNAKCIELIQGKVEILEEQIQKQEIRIKITDEKNNFKIEKYKMFVNCTGQQTIDVKDYPFDSLKNKGIISPAIAYFEDENLIESFKNSKWEQKISKHNNKNILDLGGIAIDYDFKIIKNNNDIQENLYDLSCAHISGIRPYSYGLQASDANAAILVASWLYLKKEKITLEKITNIYDEFV